MLSITIFYYIYIYFLFLFLLFKRVYGKGIILLLLSISILYLLFTYKGMKSDWYVYKNYVKHATYIGSTYFEIGFDFLCFVANKTIGFFFLPLFSAVLFIFVCSKLCGLQLTNNYNISYINIISISLTFISLFCGALRQSISTSFLLLFCYYFVKDKKFLAIVMCIAAALFHNSAYLILILIISYYIFFSVFKKNIFIISITIVTIVYLFISKYITDFLVFVDMTDYIAKASVNEEVNTPIRDLLIAIERIFFCFASFSLLKKNENRYLYFIQIISIAGNLFYLLFFSLARNLAGRTLVFFRLFDILLLYLIVTNITNALFHKNGTSFNPIGLFVCIIYSLIKFYFTIYSSGVFG